MWRRGVASWGLGLRLFSTEASEASLVRVGHTSGLAKQLGVEGAAPPQRSVAVRGLTLINDKAQALRDLKEADEKYALVALAGRQFKVIENDVIVCNKLKDADRKDVKVGDRVWLDEVLLVGSNGPILFGLPVIGETDVKVTATVIEQLKGEKDVIFKKKRRKGYKRTFGHRQQLTALRINSIQINAPAI